MQEDSLPVVSFFSKKKTVAKEQAVSGSIQQIPIN